MFGTATLSPLGTQAQVIAGQSPEGRFYNQQGRGLPFYQGKKDFGVRELLPPTTWTAQSTKEALPGDILMSVRAPVGPVNFARERVCIGRGLAAIRCREGLHPEFLYYQLLGMQDQIAGKEGAVFASINKAEIEALSVVVPSLPEQRRIVAILDEAFESIATAKANAEKNLQNARELFAAHRDHLCGADWPTVRIEDACESVMDCVNKTAPTVDEVTPFKMIRTTNVRNGRVSFDRVNYVTEEVFRQWTRRQVPLPGDVILTREAPMGEVGMLVGDDRIFLGQRLVSYRANPALLDKSFLLYALQSRNLQKQIHARASGSTVQHMRVPDSKNLCLPLPCLERQKEVVATLDALKDQTESLVETVVRKGACLDELKKSLLQQAFSGAL